MRLYIDRESDTLYFRLDESAVVDSEEVRPGFILDLDANENVVGIEVLDVSKKFRPEVLKSFQFETS